MTNLQNLVWTGSASGSSWGTVFITEGTMEKFWCCFLATSLTQSTHHLHLENQHDTSGSSKHPMAHRLNVSCASALVTWQAAQVRFEGRWAGKQRLSRCCFVHCQSTAATTFSHFHIFTFSHFPFTFKTLAFNEDKEMSWQWNQKLRTIWHWQTADRGNEKAHHQGGTCFVIIMTTSKMAVRGTRTSENTDVKCLHHWQHKRETPRETTPNVNCSSCAMFVVHKFCSQVCLRCKLKHQLADYCQSYSMRC